MKGALGTRARDEKPIDPKRERRENVFMTTFLWPAEDGWPYPDPNGDLVDIESDMDDDLLSVATDVHLLDSLDPLEREVIEARFGLHGHPVRTMKQLHADLGVDRGDLRTALGSGLAKLRVHLTA